ncbi:hypothetical protein RCZ01_15920 [Capnocytophaga felis]|uniref:Uncharacterized protein n=1 Tax=Capnocytophaga felis TaxID=2267611 RepID=A0A5M4BA41_9FLAO|nr:hypothetical protein RCZ01_15920 [Capnocytophaga felis]GET48120.1 hypothetical protein RCZ02_09510 [Capnocytophaga felis]
MITNIFKIGIHSNTIKINVFILINHTATIITNIFKIRIHSNTIGRNVFILRNRTTTTTTNIFKNKNLRQS